MNVNPLSFLWNPAGAAKDLAKDLFNPENLAANLQNKPKIVEKITGVLGTSLLVDVNKEFTQTLQNPQGAKKGAWGSSVHFLKKYVATWGILGGLLAGIGSLVTGRMQKLNETPNPWLGTITGALRFLVLAFPAASIWGQVSGAVNRVANIDTSLFLKGKGNEILNKFGFAKTVTKEDLEKTKQARIILSPSEERRIENHLTEVSAKPVKCLVIGPQSSGKAETVGKIACRIHEFETLENTQNKREVVVEKIDCAEVIEKLQQKAGQNQLLSDIAGLLPGKFSGLISLDGYQLAPAVIYGIQQRIDNAKAQGNKRLVVELVNVDKLWDLAKRTEGIDLGVISEIEDALCSLLNKSNEYDVLVTSSIADDKTLGLHAKYASLGDDFKKSGVGNKLSEAVNALEPVMISPLEKNKSTKAQIIASALKSLNVDEKAIAELVTKKAKERFDVGYARLVSSIKNDIRKSAATGDDADLEIGLDKIRELLIDRHRFDNLRHGQIPSALSGSVKDKFIQEWNQGNKDSAIEQLITVLIDKSDDLDSSTREAIDKRVGEIKNELLEDKRNIEKAHEKSGEMYESNKEIISSLNKLPERKLPQALISLHAYRKEQYDQIMFLINNCDSPELRLLKAKVDRAFLQTTLSRSTK